MKLLKRMKDGGPLSHSTGYFLVELKALFTIVLLYFSNGSRDAYHTHAFNAVSWVLKGKLIEFTMGEGVTEYTPSFHPIFTPRTRFHKVVSVGNTWALSFRGPWVAKWKEFIPAKGWRPGKYITLTHGRKEVP